MKATSFALLVGAATVAAGTARAENLILVGGRLEINRPVYRTPAVAYCPPPMVIVPGARFAPASGYWTETVVKTWVPARWVVGRDAWGRPVRTLAAGYYDARIERSWVDTRCRG